MPLVQHLSSAQFTQELDKILKSVNLTPESAHKAIQVNDPHLCGCRCGQPVAVPRKFVNQDHYSIWLAQERFFGKNRKP